MIGPDLAALRRTAAEADLLATTLRERTAGTVGAVHQIAWSGPGRDRFVTGTSELAAHSTAPVFLLTTLAADLRSLAGAAEARLAHIRSIEAAVRAELRRQITTARIGLSIIEGEMRTLAAAVALVPGMRGIEVRLATAQRRLHHLLAVDAQLPPPDDLRWEALGHALAGGRPAWP